MSCQKGNTQRSRPQKHQNHTAWKSNNTNQVLKGSRNFTNNVCTKCKELIEWKLKYNKYKPLSKPKKCTKCEGKNIKVAYHILCENCAMSLKLCSKCGTVKESDVSEEGDAGTQVADSL
ncbi:uncharacterized protein C9orf85 homolog [Styela clava]|uniref:uncharacterized protein C9orf85 homolog n=1 Tax=Styela clava TaxID=7725 RepID=UPI0019396462|nr:uncharacterized protein C9orf85 homolog [Styela clava]